MSSNMDLLQPLSTEIFTQQQLKNQSIWGVEEKQEGRKREW